MPIRLLALGAMLLIAAPAHAQPAASLDQSRPATTDYSQQVLRDLPSGDNLFSLLEVLQPTLITDRFTGSGLSVGQPARVGGFGPSWTQTLFSVDGVTITDPTTGGTPLLFPDLAFWSRMRVQTALTAATQARTGVAVDLSPAAAGDRWSTMLEAGTTRGPLAGDAVTSGSPHIARTATWDRGSIVASGPLRNHRGSAMLGGSFATSSQIDRSLDAARARVVSGLGSLTLNVGDESQLRALGWVQHREQPLEQRALLRLPGANIGYNAFHAQTVWERGGARPAARLFGGVTRRAGSTTAEALRRNGVVERLLDGPPQTVAGLGNQTVLTWTAGAALTPRVERGRAIHDLHASADVTGARADSEETYAGVVGELVGGVPARVWNVPPVAGQSSRRSVTLGATLADRIALGSRLTLDAGVRYEALTGSARGAASGISWQTVLPHASLRARLTERGAVTAFGAYSRVADRLLLDYLAVGDPAAPTATVARWNTAPDVLSLTQLGATVARVGPGTGGDPGFSAIDPDLGRPVTNEFVVGFETKPTPALLFRFTGVARRQSNLLGLVNTGVPFGTGYDTFRVPDPGGDVLNPADDRVLTVYDRRPAFFGQDRYLLTNPGRTLDFEGFELTIGYTRERVTFIAGGTAGRATGVASSRGFGPLENDQSLLGEADADPNAATLARGRMFTDRAYTGKIASVVTLPAGIRLGVIARYQDGQAFSRVVVFPNLRQGADHVRAFASGDSRFMFVGTLDARLQKRVTLGASRSLTLFADGYNLTGMAESVEEWSAQRPDDRITTAIQPPRTFHVGLRVGF